MQLLLTDTATLESNNDLPLDVFDRFGKVAKFDNITRDELLTAAADKDIILCNKTVIDREIMNAAPNLRYIGLFATGYNNIDIAAAKEKGITVCNAGSYSTNAVTQQVIGYILMHYTKIPQYDAFVKQGGWKRSGVFSPLIFEPLHTCNLRFPQRSHQQAFPIFPQGQKAVLCSLTHKEKTLQGQLTAQRTNTTRGRQIYYRHQKERMRKAAQREKRSTDKQRQKHL